MTDVYELSAVGLSYIARFSSVIKSASDLLSTSAEAVSAAESVAAAIVEEASLVAGSVVTSAKHSGSEYFAGRATEEFLETQYAIDLKAGQIGSPKALLETGGKIGLIYNDVLHADIGVGSIQLGVALKLMLTYLADNPADTLGLSKYKVNFRQFTADLMNSNSDLTAKIEALSIQNDAIYLAGKYDGGFYNADIDIKDGMLVVTNKLGSAEAERLFPTNTPPDPGNYQGGRFVLQNLATIRAALNSGTLPSGIYNPNPESNPLFSPISFDPGLLNIDPTSGYSGTTDGNLPITYWTAGFRSAVLEGMSGQVVGIGYMESNTLTAGTSNSFLYASGTGTNTFLEQTNNKNAKDLFVGRILGSSQDTTVAQSAGLSGGGAPTDIFVGGLSRGQVISIGGDGENTFKLNSTTQTGAHIYWGGGGTSTYYINGSPTVYVYYMDNPTAAKIAALTPDVIKSAYSSIEPTPTGYYHLEPGVISNGNAVFIINPGQNDRIVYNGKLIGDLDDQIGNYYNQTAWTSNPGSGGISNYIYLQDQENQQIGSVAFTPPPVYADYYVHGLTLVNFAVGDFGITYSGPTSETISLNGWLPSQEFLDWNTQFKLDVQTSDENGNQLNSDNGSIMAGNGAVSYRIAADTQTALISSQDGDQSAVVDFLGSTTLATLSFTGGGGSDGLGLTLKDTSTGQSVSVLDGLGAATTRIASLVFSNGETLSYSSILQALITASPMRTALYGDGDANVLDTQGYATYAQGNGGGDTFVYNAGYGAVEVNEIDQDATPNNVLQLGAGISAAQLTVAADAAGNLYVADGTTGDRIQLDNQLNGSANGVQSLVFADGSSMTATQLVALETTGTTGADMLYGSVGADVFDGQGAPMWSQDYEQGNGGGDTFVYDAGYGRLEINEVDKNTTPSNVLQLGPGIDATQLTVTGDYSGNLYLTDGMSGDQIQLDGQLNSVAGSIQIVAFADGSTLTAAQLVVFETAATTGADTLIGTPAPEVLDGKGAPIGSRDYEQGNGGGDTFVYNAGYGQLDISEIDNAASPHNILQLGSGITSAQLTVTADRSGSLFLSDGTIGDQIELEVQLQSSTYGVQLVTFADGSSLTASQLVALETTGTSSADTLIGSASAEVLDGKGAPAGSQDYEQGYGGGDTFVFDAGYGQLEINEDDIGSNLLQFGSGITVSQLSVRIDQSGKMLITDGIAGDLVTIDAANDHGKAGVAGISFVDGSGLTVAQLDALATIGTAGADTLYGPVAGAVFDGKGAPIGSQDYESGRGGGDTFLFNAGYGHLEIGELDLSPNPSNVLQLGAGITVSQLTVSQDVGGTIYLGDGTPGDQIKLDAELSGYGVQTVRFADGSSLSAAQLEALATGYSPGPDMIYGTGAAEVFDGKGAPAGLEDFVIGGGGGDTFVFDSGYGQLEILEGDTGTQPNNALLLGSGITASQLTVSIDQSGSFLLKDGVSGDLIKLDYQQYGGPYGVQSVQFADGTSLSTAQLAALALTGTPGADTIVGTSGADVLDGKGATAGSQDYIQGNGGGDTFIYKVGYGQLEILEFDYSGSTNVLDLGAGITQSQVTVTSDGLNVYLTDGMAGDQIKIDYGAINSPYIGIEAVQFADGSSLTKAGLLALAGAKNGTVGADSLSGGGEANTFDGKGAPAGGQDYESGGGGGDTFIFNAGYGQLEINELEYSWGPASNTLQFGPGITASQLVVSADASGNLDVTDGIAGDFIQIDGQLNDIIAGGSHGVQSILFADGSNLPLSQLTIPVAGTTGADSLHGGLGKDVFDGQGAPAGSQDYEQGSGSASFVFNAGYGQLEVNDDAGFYNDSNAVLQLGSGITPGQVSITADPSGNIVVTDGVSNDLIQIDAMNTLGYGGYSQFGVGSIQFADGTTWNNEQILGLAANGTTGSDTIAGTAGDDILDGRGGTDMITGGGGNDTYLFRSGYGPLTIDNSTPNVTSAQGQIDLGQGLTEQTLWFAQSGSDLFVTHLGSLDTIDVAGWFGIDPSSQIAAIKGADGLLSGTSDVGQLVTAMAAYASANPTFNPASAASMPVDATLQSALQTYWHT